MPSTILGNSDDAMDHSEMKNEVIDQENKRINRVDSITSGPEEYWHQTSHSGNSESEEERLKRTESSVHAARTLSRILTENRSTKSIKEECPQVSIGGGRRFPETPGNRDDYLVSFDGPKDPMHPHNWPLMKRVYLTILLGLSALTLTMGSAMYSTASIIVAEKFHVGLTTATVATSLYVFGFASGPVVWGPLSELYGRKIILVPSCLGFVCFTFGVATAKDIQTIMLCRFFAGFVGAAPLVVAPAAMADLFPSTSRGHSMNIFSATVSGGPMLAPIIGGFSVKNSTLGWRWTSYFSAIAGILPLVLLILTFEETHHPIILARKAEILRRETGNWALQGPLEGQTLSIKEIVEVNMARPLKMLLTEPILFLITLYNAFIYGLIYLLLTAIPLIFAGKYGWSSGVSELPYLAMLIGIFIASFFTIFFQKRYARAVTKNNGKPVPEEQLPPMMLGSLTFAAGLFWLGWGGAFGPRVHWIVPTIGAAFVGSGILLIFLPCIAYIVDCYLLFAASALAGNTFLRSIFGGVFPLFARQMFTKMKIQWASTLLGCVAVVLIPVPFLFYIFGRKIREKSKYAFVLD